MKNPRLKLFRCRFFTTAAFAITFIRCPIQRWAHAGQTKYTYRKHSQKTERNTCAENTIHSQKHNIFLENTLHSQKTDALAETKTHAQKILTKNTIHSQKTQYTRRKHNTLTENTIHSQKTQYTKFNIFRGEHAPVKNTTGSLLDTLLYGPSFRKFLDPPLRKFSTCASVTQRKNDTFLNKYV